MEVIRIGEVLEQIATHEPDSRKCLQRLMLTAPPAPPVPPCPALPPEPDVEECQSSNQPHEGSNGTCDGDISGLHVLLLLLLLDSVVRVCGVVRVVLVSTDNVIGANGVGGAEAVK